MSFAGFLQTLFPLQPIAKKKSNSFNWRETDFKSIGRDSVLTGLECEKRGPIIEADMKMVAKLNCHCWRSPDRRCTICVLQTRFGLVDYITWKTLWGWLWADHQSKHSDKVDDDNDTDNCRCRTLATYIKLSDRIDNRTRLAGGHNIYIYISSSLEQSTMFGMHDRNHTTQLATGPTILLGSIKQQQQQQHQRRQQ